MSRINCHSAFKHYEMFHGHGACCGGNSYGSVFNTTYNIKGGGHGGFWGGFGLGLGSFVGNLFGGFMGNMGFGFGFPNFGGGSWFNPGYSNRTSDSNSSKATVKEVVKEVVKDDPDCAKIADLAKKANSANDENAIDKLINDIDNAIKALDDNNKEAQTKTLNELKKGLEAKKDGLKNKMPEEDKDCAVIEMLTGKVKNLPEDVSQDDINKLLNEIDSAIANLDEYNKEAQQGTLNNLKGILNSKNTNKPVDNNDNDVDQDNGNVNPVSNVDTNNRTYNGALHTNVAENDIETALKSLKDIIDTSTIADFENVTVNDVKKDSQGKWTVTVKSKSGKTITYTEIGKTKDGGIVFHGKNDDQHYVLQKATMNTGERIRLMQYEDMDGWQIADVH